MPFPVVVLLFFAACVVALADFCVVFRLVLAVGLREDVFLRVLPVGAAVALGAGVRLDCMA